MNEANNLHETIHLSIKHFFFGYFWVVELAKLKSKNIKSCKHLPADGHDVHITHEMLLCWMA